MKSIEDFEKTIGYSFKDKKLLKIALTHKSYLDENPDLISNQRYEFFGDTILDFDLTEYLFKHFPDLDEGSLTKIRSSAVNQANLVKLGKEIDLLSKYPKSKRDVSKRGASKTIEQQNLARKFGKDFFDGDRANGYGGYYYSLGKRNNIALYNYYEKLGFREDPKIHKEWKCFGDTAFPSMILKL